MKSDELNLGPCCGCASTEKVRNILQMDFEAPEAFNGWGCFQCGLPMRGAIAVMCDVCLENDVEPQRICGGEYITSGARIELERFERKPFEHAMELHPKFERAGLVQVAPGTCRSCGCTDVSACLLDGLPCSWVEEPGPDGKGLCSGCA